MNKATVSIGIILITSVIILVYVFIHPYVPSAGKEMEYEGERMTILCDVCEFSGKSDLMRFSFYLNERRNTLVGIRVHEKDRKEKMKDTIVYDIYQDSIVSRDGERLYYLEEGVIKCKVLYSTHPMQLLCDYDSLRRLEKISSRLYDTQEWELHNLYRWEGKMLMREKWLLNGHPVFNIDYKDNRRHIKYGGFTFLFRDLFSRDDIPFILLGYYGVVPDDDLVSYTRKNGERETSITYQNKFGKNGILKRTIREDQGNQTRYYFTINQDILSHR